MSVQDDGTGMPDQPTDDHNGLGLRIMRDRAAIIGADPDHSAGRTNRHPRDVYLAEEGP